MTEDHKGPPLTPQELGLLLKQLMVQLDGLSVRAIAQASAELPEPYRTRFKKVAPFSASTVSALCNGKRIKLPRPMLVRAIVVSCYHAAEGFTASDGEAALPLWEERLARLLSSEETSKPGTRQAADASWLAVEAAAWDAQTIDIEEDFGILKWTLPLMQQYYRENYGPYAVRMLKNAQSGKASAMYRMGIMLVLDHRPRDAEIWLRYAESHGHRSAVNLLNALRLPNQDADEQCRHGAMHAFVLATDDDHPVELAMLFLRLATRLGVPEAAVALASCHEKRGEHAEAVYWFNWAVESGVVRRDNAIEILADELLKATAYWGREGKPVHTDPGADLASGRFLANLGHTILRSQRGGGTA